MGYRLHNVFARKLPPAPRLRAQVERHAVRWSRLERAQAVPELRYRLRRDGLHGAHLAECFGLYAACTGSVPREPVLAAAQALVRGGIVELADPGARHSALALAALARSLHGERVHLLAAHDAGVKALHALVAPTFEALGISAGCVLRAAPAPARRVAYGCPLVCASARELAQDYLRSRGASGTSQGRLRAHVERLTTAGEPPMALELGCALVDDADIAMLDDALAPVAIAGEADQSGERLLYEQALELARGLEAEADFIIRDNDIVLTEAAARLLERLVAPLGGVWRSRARREELVGLALEALHLFRRDVDYRVQAGQVIFPPRPVQAAEVPGPDEELQKLVEVKEGCRLSARREVIARISLPRFFARFAALAGTCADARSLERDFWDLYRLKTSLAAARAPGARYRARVFATAEDKYRALAAAAGDAAAQGGRITVALRRHAEAQAVQGLLEAAGLSREQVTIALLPPLQPRGEATTLLVAELPDAARHISRLQGTEPCTVLLSLDEEAVASRLGLVVSGIARLSLRGAAELPPLIAAWISRRAQRAAERAGRELRLDVKARDQALDDLLAFSGQSN